MNKRIILEEQEEITETYLWVKGIGIVFIHDEETLAIAEKMMEVMRKKVKEVSK